MTDHEGGACRVAVGVRDLVHADVSLSADSQGGLRHGGGIG